MFSGIAGLILDLVTEPHPWWVWLIGAAILIAIIVYWIKKPWYDTGLDR